MAIKDLYKGYNDLAKNRPAEVADVESFYTPELQQQILSELAQRAAETRDVNQSAISGAAIQSGFGVGGSSREAARRAKADSMALDQVISGAVQQAAGIEQMRRAQYEESKQRSLQADEELKNQRQAFALAKQGYQANLDSASRAYADQAKTDRQNMIISGLTSIGQSLPGLMNRTPSPMAPYSASSSLNLDRPSTTYTFTPFWQQS